MRRFKAIMNKSGVSLMFVILVLVVMSILSMAIFSLFTSNMSQAKYQQNSLRVHYIAISGVEAAFGALLQDNRSLLTNYFDKATNVSITPLTDSVTLNNGYASIVVSSYIDSNNERWVLITSTGHLTNSTATRIIKMNFRVSYPEVQKWE
jgi:type II secretory pathway pseudopilin PulG